MEQNHAQNEDKLEHCRTKEPLEQVYRQFRADVLKLWDKTRPIGKQPKECIGELVKENLAKQLSEEYKISVKTHDIDD